MKTYVFWQEDGIVFRTPGLGSGPLECKLYGRWVTVLVRRLTASR